MYNSEEHQYKLAVKIYVIEGQKYSLVGKIYKLDVSISKTYRDYYNQVVKNYTWFGIKCSIVYKEYSKLLKIEPFAQSE